MVSTDKSVAMTGFFDEVKRRKVYKVAAAYIIAAGGIIQLASAAFPAWDLPNWLLRLVIVLLLMGFPIALILAWAYDITAQGVRATPNLAVPGSRRRRNIAMLVVTGVIISAGAGFFLLPRVSAHKCDKSIAVLPFENLSDDKENAYFADGVQDDVLTNLSKVGDLKVISRTSVMPYRGKTSSVREIGKALGVGAILEGSVRRDGNRVRVNVQLINAENDEHMWAEDYDRDLTDVFAIQTDLAQQIVRELQAKLSPMEKAQIEKKPTQNPDAYLAFVRGHDLFTRPDKLRTDTEQAEQQFERATTLDPKFAGAFAALAWIDDWIYHTFDPTPARKEKARAAAEEAIRLQPDLPEAHLAIGLYYYYGERDYQRALQEFAIAKKSLPNSAEVYMAIASIERRQGKWAQSTVNFEKAASLSPKDSFILVNLADNYRANKNFETADKVFDRAIEAAPGSFNARAAKAMLAFDWKGDLSMMEKELTNMPPGVDPEGMVTYGRVQLRMLQRRFPEALDLLNRISPDFANHDSKPREFFEGAIYAFLDDKEKARSAFEQARPVAEQSLREAPNDAFRHALLGQILAGLGEKDAAIAEGKRAVHLLPESEDALEGPKATLELAKIYTWTGETDQALLLLDHSLSNPSGVTISSLKIDPIWDPLRSNPRFQALIDKYDLRV
jgi:TolB-like protein/Tfp pilus assembly protein PilF/predicted negative regulator of RcsB-dependent stress response